MLTDFETGTEPDVLFFFTNADAEPIVKAGKVVDIATIRAEYPDYGSNMRDSMLAVASDGKSYAVPSSGGKKPFSYRSLMSLRAAAHFLPAASSAALGTSS